MKTQVFSLIKTLAQVALSLTLLLTVSCNNKVSNEKQTKTKKEVSETAPKPPAMDIHTAAFMGNAKAIHQHINAKSDLNQKDQYGSTPLLIACTFGKTEVAKALIEGGADLTVKNNDGSNALHVAAFFCRIEIVKALLAKNVDKTVKNNYGSTALESIKIPFSHVKPVYDQISKDLGSMGLKLDYKYLETTRPKIAELLQ